MKAKWIVTSIGIVIIVIASIAGVGLSLDNTAKGEGSNSGSTPEEVVSSFYGWYLDYINGGETMRNPLVDKAYRDCGFLTQDFVARIDEMLSSQEKSAGDPILMAQDVPVEIEVKESQVTGDTATVIVDMYWGGNPNPSERVVTLEGIDGAWLIAGVSFCGKSPEQTMDKAPNVGWSTFSDEEFGFRFDYPSGWRYQELEAKGPGIPDDWPLERIVIFYPEEWAARFTRTGPPDPEAPPAIPAFSLEVYVGSNEDFRRVFVEPNIRESLNIAGNVVTREEESYSESARQIRYIFQSKVNSQARIVLSDNYSGFADRVIGNEHIVGRIPQILETFRILE